MEIGFENMYMYIHANVTAVIAASCLYKQVSSVENLITQRSKQKEQIRNTPRRMCGLQHAPQEVDVLGKIAHLAEVGDNDIARVLSWHMSADMDCVVTLSTKKVSFVTKHIKNNFCNISYMV